MIQIQGGEFRSRVLETPKGAATRPTSSKLRAALCDASQGLIEGARVLDAFAGSGAMGLELLSRGAAHATFVENDKRAFQTIQRNIEALKVKDRSTLLFGSVFKHLTEWNQTFDLVFLDPPYDVDLRDKLFTVESLDAVWRRVLAPRAVVAIEWSPREINRHGQATAEDFLIAGNFAILRDRSYGDTQLTQLVWLNGDRNG